MSAEIPTREVASPSTPDVAVPPARFRAAEARNRRLGRPLRAVGRIGEVDEQLMQRIGRAMGERDELGARLADAIRLRAGEPGRVTMTQFRQALDEGVASVTDAPPALRDFFAEVEREPEWLDRSLAEEGARAFRRFGQNAQDVLLQLSLVGGYRFGGPTDLLVATGGLTGGQTVRRLAETQKWGASLTDEHELRPPAPGRRAGEAWRLTVHVRLMHAMVNHAYAGRWDTGQWGLPINQADQASTLGLFDGVLLLGVRALGVPVSRRDSRAVMHLWKYVGWLMGVADDFLVDSERERHRINYHVLLAQGPLSEAGPLLSQAVVAAQLERHYPGWPRPLQPLRGAYERERLLSMLTVFLGTTSMHELGLPVRLPWAHAYLAPLNTVRYRLLGRLPGARTGSRGGATDERSACWPATTVVSSRVWERSRHDDAPPPRAGRTRPRPTRAGDVRPDRLRCAAAPTRARRQRRELPARLGGCRPW
ncbi:oxygenase MpaB family protein [Nocardioides alcanivorans]|uniref:oxygenase MpaB family protein n=1 Tax=Nocardioides alcanivorans TaxID=2897352 RepID=UPI001F3DBE3B|nr:oxygenase MpaB family protein [Nocardioides alcanivorans]